MDELILVDGHVHFHDCFDLCEFLNIVQKNFLKIAKQFNYSQNFSKVICFTESENADYFNKLKSLANTNSKVNNWQFSLTNNLNSIVISSEENNSLIIFAGRQIVTLEKLEVLAIGLVEKIKDGQPINEVIKKVNDLGNISIVPWGAGKWFGKRGEIVKKLVNSDLPLNFFLGDNGNRPVFWPTPSLFKLAESKQIYNLPGSDPLPVKSGMKNVGKSGFVLKGILDIERPFEDFFEKLQMIKEQPKTFNTLEKPLNFFKNQLFMQVYKRKK